jgi:mannose-6-phosphate isomerase-like protein (cupin superfamily)
MKINFKKIKYIPASHEDFKDPGVLKKVLLKKGDIDLNKSELQMINWAKMKPGKRFEAHYHEDMAEIFIIISGQASIKVGDHLESLEKGDLIYIREKEIHEMRNTGKKDFLYLAIGFSFGNKGKTVVI